MSKTPRRRFTDDFKAQAVSLSNSVGRTTAARQLGMSVKTLARWVGAANAGQPLTSPKRTAITEVESELARLRAENATLKMEREILKKAAAFFAKESR
jgi:transposase